MKRNERTTINHLKKTTNTSQKKTNYDLKRVFEIIDKAIAEDRYAFHEPTGNSKTGADIPAWNLVPGRTCSPEACAHCLREGCYALKNMLRAGYSIDGKNYTFRNWTDNTVMAMHHLDELETKLDDYLTATKPRFFRIHAAGDFFSVAYAEMWFRLAEKHSETNFLAFTKQWKIVREVPFHTLKNFSLVLSGWTGVVIPDDLKKIYRCAWCDDGIETRIPETALECPGNCDTCGLCWKLRELNRDTFFHKH